MNLKLIIFSGMITAAVGSGVGWLLANIFPTPYTMFYQNQERSYIIIGAVGGLLLGSSQESLRQLKVQRDREESSR